MTSGQDRSEAELTDDERALLEGAYRRLSAASSAYQRFLGTELSAGNPVPVHDGRAMAEAQAEEEAAKDDLWRLREDLLGWRRST